ncbi:uncharacterized protein LOC115240185, partial [Formica exsecta]|uniref:uncharacterized protein LOC115240185 n=1 Tax=Formica exsecta TaxID=72781 RepID=UPI0011426014
FIYLIIAELRHIWTDGRRKLSMFNDTPLWRWTWESTGELVSEMGVSFVPWCLAGQCHNNDANCLNFDHADYTPIIYGLNCNQSQTYICQPWSAACAPRRSNLDTSYALSGNNDLLQTFSLSKTTTASYYDEEDNQKSVHATIPLFTNHSFPSSTNQTDNLQNNFFFKEERNSIIPNSSDYKNNYIARKSYTEKIIYVEEKEEKASDNNITVFLIPSYHIFEKPIKIKLTSKDAGNNIHGKFKSNSSFSNIIVSSRGNNKIWNKSIFRYLPIPVFNARSYNKIKIYPGIFRSLVYFLPNRYYYP